MIDTHAHIYHGDRETYPTIPDPFWPPEGVGTIEHLRRDAAAAGVDRVVLVQTGSAYRWDNRLLADTARENANWTVGVCTLDPASEESPAELERLVRDHNVKGVRVEATRSDTPVYDHDGSAALWAASGELNAVVCAHVQAVFLPELDALLGRFRGVNVVLDHAAYPKGADGSESATVRAVADLARHPQLHVKLTFAVTGSDEAYPFSDTHGIVHAVLDAFGPDRCMWGSDFPCEHWLKKASYAEHLDLFRKELGLSDAVQQAVLSETAERLWFA